MSDMQSLDLAKLMTGTIFFKVAGLLLPVIYIIMVSISLISGQVDSGSMAYIVSTPTKRRTVTITQTGNSDARVLGWFFVWFLCGFLCVFLWEKWVELGGWKGAFLRGKEKAGRIRR